MESNLSRNRIKLSRFRTCRMKVRKMAEEKVFHSIEEVEKEYLPQYHRKKKFEKKIAEILNRGKIIIEKSGYP